MTSVERNRKLIDTIKTTTGCEHPECRKLRAEWPAVVLQFDHLPGTRKEYNVSEMTRMSRGRILTEIAKCQVLCANHHAIETADRRS